MATKKVNKKLTKSTKKSTAKKPIKEPTKKLTKKIVGSVTKKVSKSENNLRKTSSKEVSKSFIALVVVAVIIILIAVIVAIVSTRPRNISSEAVSTIEDINSSLKMNIKKPSNASNVSYEIENGNVAKISYKKKGYDGMEIEFVMRSASSEEDIKQEDEHEWGTPIMMVTKCKDGSDIEVTSSLATDVENVMKGEWFDNDLYYEMTTDSLTTREDFLQEVNRVIIENHIEF